MCKLFKSLHFCAILFAILKSVTSSNTPKFRYDYAYDEEFGGWLKLHRVWATWEDAFGACKAEGSTLASPLTDVYRSAMLSLMRNSKLDATFVHTGIRTIMASSDFHSVEGVPLASISILKGIPIDRNQGCVSMNSNQEYRLANCTVSLPFVCYRKKSKDDVITECGTVDKGYKLDKRTGKCYKYHQVGRDWGNAHAWCLAEGGHLAILNSEVEHQVIKEMLPGESKETGLDDLWYLALLGMYDSELGWFTIHGQTLPEAGYDFVSVLDPFGKALSPYNLRVMHTCGGMRMGGVLKPVTCDIRHPFICEMDPKGLQ